jgi:hypothetical protein
VVSRRANVHAHRATPDLLAQPLRLRGLLREHTCLFELGEALVEATGPDDPAIPFEPVVAASVTAIGWCAPVDGLHRPPVAVIATLYRVQDGVARAVPYDRLEPAEPDSLGELWLPPPRGVGNRPTWPMGRYVIELRSESGTYRRFLGLELMDRVTRAASPSPTPG